MDRIAEILVDYERRRQHGNSLVFSTFGTDYRLVCLQLAAFYAVVKARRMGGQGPSKSLQTVF